MLVLSRKLGERLYLNDNVRLTVVEIDRGKIRLGIEAPPDVRVFREEILPAGFVPRLGEASDSGLLTRIIASMRKENAKSGAHAEVLAEWDRCMGKREGAG